MKVEGINNKLSELINIEKAKRTLIKGDNVLIKDIMQEIAEHCNVTFGTISAYKKGQALPSIPVAIKLSEYFNVTVNDIFIIEDYKLATENSVKRGRKPSNQNKKCNYGECQNIIVAKGLCSRHYQQHRQGLIKIDD